MYLIVDDTPYDRLADHETSARWLLLAAVLGLAMALYAAPAIRSADLHEAPATTYNAAHANACRALHYAAFNRRATALAVLACEQPQPDLWLGVTTVLAKRQEQR